MRLRRLPGAIPSRLKGLLGVVAHVAVPEAVPR